MNVLSWRIGTVSIFSIVELEAGELIQSIIKGATSANIREIGWLYPHFADESGNLKALVQAFLIKTRESNILIDTCNGNDKTRTDVPQWGNLQTEFLEKLAEIGATERDIDIVACTHLHMDHVGWNTTLEGGVWVPTFPNAQYLFAREEYEYWKKKPEKEIADDKAAFDDSIAPIVSAGLARFVEPQHQINDEISFIPSPGHTPCHVSVLIKSHGESAIISGDFLHHPCQIARPEWTTDADTLPEKAIETRKNILAEIADSNTLLIGSHFAEPVAGKVARLAAGLVFSV